MGQLQAMELLPENRGTERATGRVGGPTGMSHVFSFEPPATDQYEEQARYECMRLVQDGRLDGPRVLSQRDDGVPWSVIRDMATPPRRSAV